jgi:hypothetical protein
MKKINRRDVIKYVSLLTAFSIPLGLKAKSSDLKNDEQPMADALQNANALLTASKESQLVLRKQARKRIRRMIMNNDGNDINLSNDGFVSPELFLNSRTSPLLGSHVDTIMYCDGVNDKYSHASKLTQLPINNKKAMRTINALKEINTDPLGVMVDFCRQHGKEIFWSMRMNDLHDSAATSLDELTKWKIDHPQYLMGTPGDKSKFLYKWTALNYGEKEVRNRVLSIIKDVITGYDLDGIELDFFRHPLFFKSQYLGGEATAEDCRQMTELIGLIRTACDQIGQKRNKPLLLAIRIPDSLNFAKAIGLDVKNWLEQDWIDLMSAGDYFKFEPWKNWAALGNTYKIPVYAVLTQRRLSDTLNPEEDAEMKLWRGEAIIALEAGINGIYTFNCFKPHDPLFRELGDLALLKTLPHVTVESFVNPKAKGVVSPNTWLKNAGAYFKKL